MSQRASSTRSTNSSGELRRHRTRRTSAPPSFQPARRNDFQPFRRGREPGRRGRRVHHLERMRLEGDQHAAPPRRRRPSRRLLEHRVMAAMHAVEGADRHHVARAGGSSRRLQHHDRMPPAVASLGHGEQPAVVGQQRTGSLIRRAAASRGGQSRSPERAGVVDSLGGSPGTICAGDIKRPRRHVERRDRVVDLKRSDRHAPQRGAVRRNAGPTRPDHAPARAGRCRVPRSPRASRSGGDHSSRSIACDLTVTSGSSTACPRRASRELRVPRRAWPKRPAAAAAVGPTNLGAQAVAIRRDRGHTSGRPLAGHRRRSDRRCRSPMPNRTTARYRLTSALDEPRQSRRPADQDHQQPGRERIERAGVADRASAELPPHDRDDIVRRPAGRLVNEQPTRSGGLRPRA